MKVLALALLLAAAIVAALAPAAARTTCANYSVTAPVIGTKSDTRCSPVLMPTNFTNPLGGGSCPSVPPAGLKVCVSATTHMP